MTKTPKVYLSINSSKQAAWQRFKSRWSNCRLCPLYKNRSKLTVNVRGQAPADVVFVGEGPGESEDLIGFTFVGPAGKLLDEMIEEAKVQSTSYWEEVNKGKEIDYSVTDKVQSLRIAFVNLVACIPIKEGASRLDGTSVREPKAKEISQCHPRLKELLDILEPTTLILAGKQAQKLNLPGYMIQTMAHPASLLRNPDARQYGIEYAKCVHAIRNALVTTAQEDIIPF